MPNSKNSTCATVDHIVFDGSPESLATAIEILLSLPAKHDFGCRPSSGYCTHECLQRKNHRKIAETALCEYRRTLEQQNSMAAEAGKPLMLQLRH